MHASTVNGTTPERLVLHIERPGRGRLASALVDVLQPLEEPRHRLADAGAARSRECPSDGTSTAADAPRERGNGVRGDVALDGIGLRPEERVDFPGRARVGQVLLVGQQQEGLAVQAGVLGQVGCGRRRQGDRGERLGRSLSRADTSAARCARTERLSGLGDARGVCGVHHEQKRVRVREVPLPQRPHSRLTADIPHRDAKAPDIEFGDWSAGRVGSVRTARPRVRAGAARTVQAHGRPDLVERNAGRLAVQPLELLQQRLVSEAAGGGAAPDVSDGSEGTAARTARTVLPALSKPTTTTLRSCRVQ